MAAPKSKPKTSPVAQRIRTWCSETGTSLRRLSELAGLNATHAQKVCDRLDEGGDVGVDTLTALAQAMGRPLIWLLYGDAPPEGVELSTLPGWEEAAREAVERFGLDPAAVKGVARWRVHEKPRRVDALFVAGLARAWMSST